MATTTFASSNRFVLYEHTTAPEHNGPGQEFIDLTHVSAVGWQPRTPSNDPYWYLQLGEQRRKFYVDTDATAQGEWEQMSLQWIEVVELEFTEDIIHHYNLIGDD